MSTYMIPSVSPYKLTYYKFYVITYPNTDLMLNYMYHHIFFLNVNILLLYNVYVSYQYLSIYFNMSAFYGKVMYGTDIYAGIIIIYVTCHHIIWTCQLNVDDVFLVV